MDKTQAQVYLADAMELFDLERWVDGSINGAFGTVNAALKSAKVLAKYKHGGTLMSRNGGVRFVYQFPDQSRVCIGPFKGWMRLRELPDGLTLSEAWEVAKAEAAAYFDAASQIVD